MPSAPFIGCLLFCLLVAGSYGRISRETTTEMEPMDMGHESTGRLPDALKDYLQELDKYVAIAGRPRFGRSGPKENAYRTLPPPSLLYSYMRNYKQ